MFGHIGPMDTYEPITDFTALVEAQPGLAGPNYRADIRSIDLAGDAVSRCWSRPTTSAATSSTTSPSHASTAAGGSRTRPTPTLAERRPRADTARAAPYRRDDRALMRRVPWDEAPGWDGTPSDRDVRPMLDEVLAVIASLSAERARIQGLAARAGMATAGDVPFKECLLIVLDEEWEHRGYAERDLAKVAGRIALPSDGVERARTRRRWWIALTVAGSIIVIAVASGHRGPRGWLTAEPREVGVQETVESFREDAEEVTTVDGVYVYDTRAPRASTCWVATRTPIPRRRR